MVRFILSCLALLALAQSTIAAENRCTRFDASYQPGFVTECLLQQAPQQTAVHKLDARWYRLISTHELKKLGGAVAVVTMCGGELRSCELASAMLTTITSRCSKVFAGIIDVHEYPDVPRDLVGPIGSKLTVYQKFDGLPLVERLVSLTKLVTPAEFAAAACPLATVALQ